MRSKQLVTPLLAACLVGCAATPPGTTSYYFPKATTQLVVTQTLTCNAAGDQVRQLVTVTPTTGYSSDLNGPMGILNPAALDSHFNASDLTINFTNDGRLSGINYATTGEGSALLKDAVSIAAAAGLVAVAATPPADDLKGACKKIAELAGAKSTDDGSSTGPGTSTSNRKATAAAKEKPKADATPTTPTLTLTWKATFGYGKRSGAVGPTDFLGLIDVANPAAPVTGLEMAPDASSLPQVLALKRFLTILNFTARVDFAQKVAAARWSNFTGSNPTVQLNSVAQATLSVKGPNGDFSSFDVVWSDQIPVPLTSKEDLFEVPIPKTASFGDQKFVLGLSDYGSITKLQYVTSKSTDAADSAASLATTLAKTFKPQTAGEQAKALQEKSDLIYQQERLAGCQSSPTSCTK